MTSRWTHVFLRPFIYLVMVLLAIGGLTPSAHAAPAASPVVETPGTIQAAAEATATETPSATATLASDQLSINGSQASSVIVLTTGRATFDSGSGWIGFYSDAACANLLGTAKSPQDEEASFYVTAYGSSFWAAGVTPSNVPTTTCRQVTIAAPTPTPAPPASMTIDGKTGDIFVGDVDHIDFAVPEQPGASYALYYFLDGGCLAYVTNTPFPANGHLYIYGTALEDIVGQSTLSVYAMRQPDGATTPCQRIYVGDSGGETRDTPTPGMTTTPGGPQQTPTDPTVPTVPAPTVNVTAIPTESASATGAGSGVVTSLPNTGSGPATQPWPIATLLSGSLLAIALVFVRISRNRRLR